MKMSNTIDNIVEKLTDDRLHRLHKQVFERRDFNGTYRGFNEKNFHKYRRAVEGIIGDYPEKYNEHIRYINMYYDIFVKHR